MTFYVETHNHIAQAGLDVLCQHGGQINVPDQAPDGILLRSAVLELHNIADSVQIIARAGAGVNNIPVAAMTERGIPVLNTPGANANAVKDLVLLAMLNHYRHTQAAWTALDQMAVSQTTESAIENMKKQFVGSEISGKTLGVVGLGAVGVHVVNAAVALGMRVMGYDPFIQRHHAKMLSDDVDLCTHIEAVLAQSDFVSLHVPLSAKTKHMIDAKMLQHMAPHGVLLNFARGPVIEEAAVCAALQQQRLAHYITDFPNATLLQHDRVTCYPHLGASTHEAEQTCAVMAAKQMALYMTEGAIVHAVNFPNMPLPPLTHPRLCIVNQNVPTMVSQITDTIGHAKINIRSLNNASLQNLAYTIIDLEHHLPEAVQQRLTAIEGILRVRLLLPEHNEEHTHDHAPSTEPAH